MMRGWMTGLVALLALACAGALAQTASAPRAWLDRNSVQLGESVTLNVEASGDALAAPDFSALSQDFELLGTQSSRRINISNGQRSSTTLWAVGLQPRREGSITIAPIHVGGLQTAAIELSVLPAPAAGAAAGGDAFIEATAIPTDPYVQQQVRFTVKLFVAHDLTDGNLTEPTAAGLDVKRLGTGQDRNYFATVGERRYHVYERHYALTPTHSGKLGIAPITFSGSTLQGADPGGFFSRGRRLGAASPAIELTVRPRPAAVGAAPWLPAAALTLQDQDALPSQVRVGEPVTRTIRLQAKGLAFEQLPEIELAAPDGAEIYPDQSETRTRDDGEWLYGERVRKFALVPTRPGELLVPGLRVSWWDTLNDRAAVAELPSRTLRVLPAPAAAAGGAGPAAGAAGQSAPPAIALAPDPPSAAMASGAHRWQWIAGGLFALWLATLALWWRWQRRPLGTRAACTPPARAGEQRAAFLRACALGDLAAAERTLVAWALAERAGMRNLGALAAALADPAQRAILEELERVRYAGASGTGLATRLAVVFKPGFAWTPAATPGADSLLPPLYPH